MFGELPQTVEVSNVARRIRTDYRDIINILVAQSDPNLDNDEKTYICLFIFYVDFDELKDDELEEAFQKALAFIDAGLKSSNVPGPRLMDWEHDEPIIFSAVNKVAGTDVRNKQYIHWWTFLGYYLEISESFFSQVISIRKKRASGKKLEPYEREFYKANKNLIQLKEKLSDEEEQARKEEKERLNQLIH